MDAIKICDFFLVVLLGSIGITRVSTSCQNKYVINRGVSCEDKELILEMHNQLRQSVALGQVQGQPPASAMMLLSWDEELARKAQSLADTCHYGHDSNNARAVNRFYVGQNIALTWSTWEKSSEPDFASQIKAWFNEVDTYAFNSGFSHRTGHYSQMVWADTYLIGCGFNYFYDGYRYQKVYVCNYGPGGNVQGKSPYYPGQPSCGYYGMISSTKYYGLCDSYRSFYPDYSCYRYRRDAKDTKELVVSQVAKIMKIKKTDAKKTEAKKTDAKKMEAKKTDAKKTEAKKTDAKKTDIKKMDAKKKSDSLKPKISKTLRPSQLPKH